MTARSNMRCTWKELLGLSSDVKGEVFITQSLNYACTCIDWFRDVSRVEGDGCYWGRELLV